MATRIGSVVIDIDARLTALEANLAKANRSLGKFDRDARSVGSRIEGSFKKIAATAITLAGAFAATGILQFARQSLDATGGLGELSQQLGVTTDQLQVYQYAATQAGVSNEELGVALGQLTRRLGQASLGVKKPAEAFRALGIDIKNADGSIKTAGQALPDLAEGLSKLESPAQRAALATEFLGKSGQKLLPILESGRKGLNEYEQAARSLGVVLSTEQIAKADEAADKLAALNLVLSQRFAGVVADNADALLRLGEAIASAGGNAAKWFGVISELPDRFQRRGAQFILDNSWMYSDESEKIAQDILIKQNRASLDRLSAASRFKYLPPAANDGALGDTTLGSVFATPKQIKEQKTAIEQYKEGLDALNERILEVRNSLGLTWGDDSSPLINVPKSTGAVLDLSRALKDAGDAATAAINQGLGPIAERMEELDRFASDFAASFSSAFEDAFLSGDWDGILDGLLEDLARLIIRLTIIEPLARRVKDAIGEGGGGLGGLFNAVVSSIGTVFGGGRAFGGSVDARTTYLVGERGPEYFTPNVAGMVTPANDVGGGLTRVEIVPSQYFDARVQQISGQTVARAAPAIVQGSVATVRNGLRRNRKYLG